MYFVIVFLSQKNAVDCSVEEVMTQKLPIASTSIISSAVAQMWVNNSFTSHGVKDFNSPLRLEGGIHCQYVETGIFLSLWSSWGDLMRLAGH